MPMHLATTRQHGDLFVLKMLLGFCVSIFCILCTFPAFEMFPFSVAVLIGTRTRSFCERVKSPFRATMISFSSTSSLRNLLPHFWVVCGVGSAVFPFISASGCARSKLKKSFRMSRLIRPWRTSDLAFQAPFQSMCSQPWKHTQLKSICNRGMLFVRL